MDNFTFNLVLLLFGGFIGVLFVMMILRAIRGSMWSHGTFPAMYPSDPYYRERSDWWGILLFFGLLALISLLFSDGFSKLGDQVTSVAVVEEQNRKLPLDAELQDVPEVVQGQFKFQTKPETVDTTSPETALPLSDYLTEDYYYIQYTAGGDLENMLEAKERLSLRIDEFPFIVTAGDQYKLLTGPYQSKDLAEFYAEESGLNTYIRTGEGLDLFDGY